MSAFALVYSLGSKHGLRPLMWSETRFDEVFEDSSDIPTVEEFFCDDLCSLDWKPFHSWISPTKNSKGDLVNLKDWTLRWFKASVPYLDELRRLFRPKDRFMRRAGQILDEISAKRDHPVLIGVHVRRTDYLHHVKEYGNGHLVIGKYFEKAMRYLGEKFSNVAFVVVSDNMGWCRKHFSHLNDVDFVAAVSASIC